METAKPQCRIVVSNGYRGETCSKPAVLTAELGRAKRRAELDQKIERATIDLARTGPSKVANADAVALATYLQALGLSVDADRVNKLLILIAVLVIDCGSGLSLAVAMALGEGGRPMPERNRGTANGALTGSTSPLAPENAQPHKMPAVVDVLGAAGGSQQSEAPTRTKLLQMVAGATGGLRTSEHALGSRLGISSTRARRLLGELAAAGTIRLRSSSTGTTIT